MCKSRSRGAGYQVLMAHTWQNRLFLAANQINAEVQCIHAGGDRYWQTMEYRATQFLWNTLLSQAGQCWLDKRTMFC